MKQEVLQLRSNHKHRPAKQQGRFSVLEQRGRYITLARLFVAAIAASAVWPISESAAILLLFCLTLVPVPTTFQVSLKSGRLLRKARARLFYCLPDMRRVLEVHYESCTDDYRSIEFLREEVDVATSVMDECETLGINSVEIIVVLPTAMHGFNLEKTTIKTFEKVNGRWVDASNCFL